MGAKGCNTTDWSAVDELPSRETPPAGAGLRLSAKREDSCADAGVLPLSRAGMVKHGTRALGWHEWIEAAQAAETLQNLQGGRWTEDQYGGVMDDAGVCLDARGWDDASVDCSTRRRTVSDPAWPARAAGVEDSLSPFSSAQFAPGGFGAVGGTNSASRRGPDLSGRACEIYPGMTRIGSRRPSGWREPIPGFPFRQLLVGEFSGAQGALQNVRVQISRASTSRREMETPVVLPIREGAETTRD